VSGIGRAVISNTPRCRGPGGRGATFRRDGHVGAAGRIARAALALAATTLVSCSSPPIGTRGESGGGSASPAGVAGDAPAQSSDSPERHPLLDRVWDARARTFIDDATIVNRAVGARFVLLGEVHDNPRHHVLRYDVVAAMIAHNRAPAIAMEQIDRDRQAVVTALMGAPRPTPAAVADVGGIKGSNWNWDYYAPFVTLAIEHRLPLIAANLSRDAAREVARKGFAALGPSRAAVLAIESSWDPAREQALRELITEGHCGMSPGPAIEGMTKAQRARDAVMAEAIAGEPDRGTVLITGNGHVRRDWGVPFYLARYVPTLSAGDLLVVGYLEVDAERTRPEEYVASPVSAAPLYDIVRFTAPAPREDPCEALRKSGPPHGGLFRRPR